MIISNHHLVFTTFIIFMIIINTNGGYIKTYEDVEYFISNPYRTNWYRALKYCKDINKELISFEIDGEHTDILPELEQLNQSEGARFWCSGTDLGESKRFFWATTGNNFTTTYWVPGEPNNAKSNEHCVEFHVNKTIMWNDDPCDFDIFFVCVGYKMSSKDDYTQN